MKIIGNMDLTKKQTEEELSKFLRKENGLNEVLEMLLNALMLSERSDYLRKSISNKGNGYRLGNVFGYGNQIELRIPRDRQSAFTPTILALFREQESYLKEVSFELYSKGLTTRDISDVMETIYGNHYSKSTISNISKSFYDQMESWRNRELEEHYLALFIDGLHVKVRRDGIYQNECYYIILGLKEDYTREVISIVTLPSESSNGWRLVFEELKTRGLNSVGIIVSDGVRGLDSAIAEYFPKAAHQNCIVHLQRNLKNYVRREDRAELAEDIRQVLSPDDQSNTIKQAQECFIEIAHKWEPKYKSLYKYMMNLELQPYLTFLNYSTKIRRMIYTTNWIERFNRSARRTLKVRGAFPDQESVLALITSVAMEKGEKKYRYPVHNFKFEPKLHRKMFIEA